MVGEGSTKESEGRVSVVKCDKHNVIFNPHNAACVHCRSSEEKEEAYSPTLLQELRDKADIVVIKEDELLSLKHKLTAAEQLIAELKSQLEPQSVESVSIKRMKEQIAKKDKRIAELEKVVEVQANQILELLSP